MNGFSKVKITRFGNAPVLVFCDHATNALPEELDGLRLPEDLLQTHIAYDIGALGVSDRIAHALDGTLVSCGFSRLVIDPNRDPAGTDSIPGVSDGVHIPGNNDLSNEERISRRVNFFEPYHEALTKILDEMSEDGAEPFVISIHSFTKRMTGAREDRPWPIGVLWRWDEQTAHTLISWLKSHTGWAIGDNEPYDARIFNYTIDRHVGPRNLPHITVEVRQDLVTDKQGVIEIASIIADAAAAICEKITARKGAA